MPNSRLPTPPAAYSETKQQHNKKLLNTYFTSINIITDIIVVSTTELLYKSQNTRLFQ